MEHGREHIVLVVAYGLFTVDLGIVEDIADLLCDSSSGISYGNEITLDLTVLGLVNAKARKTDDRIDRCS